MKSRSKFLIRQKKLWSGVIAAVLIALAAMPVYAMEDGAYTVPRTTSYVNPETGQTADGGTNIALGDSMCASIVEDTALVEQSQGKTYVTLGMGLMSNVSNVRIQIQGTDGSYRDAELVQTGSCERDGDVCNHYRFEVDSSDLYISPVIYVTPMGRDVQFFVKLDMSAPQPGSGNFVSEMISAEVPADVESQNTELQTEEPQTEESAEEVQAEAKDTDTQTETTAKQTEKETNKGIPVAGIAAVAAVIIIGAGGVIIYKKRKK